MNRLLAIPIDRRKAAALLVLLTGAAAWLWAHEGHEPLPTRGAQVDVAKGQLTLSAEARAALDVQTGEAEPRLVEEKLLAYARLVAPWQRHAFATTRLPGRIVKVHAQPGQTVAAGAVLAEVESLELKNLQLELVNAQNDLKLSEKILKDLEPARRRGSISEQRLAETEIKHRQDVNALAIARSKWLSLGLGRASLDEFLRERDLQRARTFPVTSPIAWTVIHTDLVVGRIVEPAEHLFEIVDLSTVWAQMGVLEKDLHRVEVGQPVEFTWTAYPGEVFHGTVQVKGVYLDPQTHLGTVWAELPNPPGREPRLLPGLHGQAHLLIAGAAKTLTIPAAALIRAGAERYVFVEETATAQASQYQKQNVVVGRQTPEFVEVRGGHVVPGDRVVTQGGHELATFFVPGVLRPSPEAARNIGLHVEAASRHVVEEVVQIEGTVEVPPDRRSSAASPLAGTLHRIQLDRGQAVRAGDVLAEIASLELQNLQLDLLRTHLESALLEEALTRLRAAAQSLPGRQLWEAESQHQAAVNRRASLEQKLQTIGLTPEQVRGVLQQRQLVEALPLRAPLDGVVARFDKALGQAVKADEPLVEIHDLSHVRVHGYVPERDLPRVRLDQAARVRLTAYPGQVIDGSVTRSGRVFAADSRTLSVWVKTGTFIFSSETMPVPFLHDMLAQVTLSVREPEPVLAVPHEAVVREGLRAYVFVRQADGTFGRRLVVTGRADDRRVAITRGLEAGESIATRGTAELQTAYAGLR